MSLPRAFAAVVVSGALLVCAAALAPAASAAPSTSTVATPKITAPVLRTAAPTGHLRVVISGVSSITLKGHLR